MIKSLISGFFSSIWDFGLKIWESFTTKKELERGRSHEAFNDGEIEARKSEAEIEKAADEAEKKTYERNDWK